MRVTHHPLSGVLIVELAPLSDERGNFMRIWDKKILGEAGIGHDWVQENQSLSLKKHTLRGLHFQRAPFAENKLVRCVRGRMLDVFVDLRKGSPTYGKHGSVELDSDTPQMVLVPRGFAHGYMTLVDNCIASYKVDAVYNGQAEGGIRWNDPALGIEWPAQPASISGKDETLSLLADARPVEL